MLYLRHSWADLLFKGLAVVPHPVRGVKKIIIKCTKVYTLAYYKIFVKYKTYKIAILGLNKVFLIYL